MEFPSVFVRSIAALATLALSVPPQAAGIRILSPTGGSEFDSLPQAVAAAVEGDVLLVGPGNYSGFVDINGKSLSIFGVGTPRPLLEDRLSIRNLSADQSVVWSGVDVGTLQSSGWVEVRDCVGIVRIQDAVVRTPPMGPNFFCAVPYASPAMAVGDCASVALIDCELIGNTGASWDGDDRCGGGDGGHGLQVWASRVAVYNTMMTGGHGGSGASALGAGCAGGRGGRGLSAGGVGTEVYLAGCTAVGGHGGFGGSGFCPGSGGDGLNVAGNALVDYRDSSFVGGDSPGSTRGVPIGGAGQAVPLPSSARVLAAPTFVAAPASVPVLLTGEPGDRVWSTDAEALAHVFHGHALSVWLLASWFVRYPSHLSVQPSTVLDAAGLGSVPLFDGALPAGSSHQALAGQALFMASGGRKVFSSPRHALVLSEFIGPDCDGDGISDYYATVFGLVPDTNGNLVPDACDP